MVTGTRRRGYVFATVCLSVSGITQKKSLGRILMKIFGGVGSVRKTGNTRLDLGGDPRIIMRIQEF